MPIIVELIKECKNANAAERDKTIAVEERDRPGWREIAEAVLSQRKFVSDASGREYQSYFRFSGYPEEDITLALLESFNMVRKFLQSKGLQLMTENEET
ncbi:hypothetical protein BV898_04833 [Hypsibius exemplaris]|uniref:Uncharacterized protein n=1 Tax=Hypsibius exemplaris TaxID=2072580 RepID=A0A1W0X0Q8_HYPEX|nr:hypothetical protein BV898_04833 [Hypsibius exemplaris]